MGNSVSGVDLTPFYKRAEENKRNAQQTPTGRKPQVISTYHPAHQPVAPVKTMEEVRYKQPVIIPTETDTKVPGNKWALALSVILVGGGVVILAFALRGSPPPPPPLPPI